MPINTANATQADIKAAETAELLALYNRITNRNTKKFADRKTAESQTWKAIQQLAPGEDINKPVKKSTPKKKEVGKRDVAESRLIKVLVKENPKRPGSRAHKKFEILMEHDGKTVRELKAREGKFTTLDDEQGWPATELRWAIKLGLVKLENV